MVFILISSTYISELDSVFRMTNELKVEMREVTRMLQVHTTLLANYQQADLTRSPMDSAFPVSTQEGLLELEHELEDPARKKMFVSL